MSFYRFNALTGRLIQATQNQALRPLAPNKLQSTQIPNLVYDTIKSKPVQTMSVTRQKSTLHPRMQRLYEKFQEDMEKPSYLLAGTRDKVILGLCIAATSISFMTNVYYFLDLLKKY